MLISLKYFKPITFLLYGLIIILFSCNSKNDVENSLNKRGLKGNVYKLKERHYLAKMHFGNIVPDTSALYTGKERVPESINPKHAGLFEFIEGPLNREFNEDLTFYKNGFLYRDIKVDDNGIKYFNSYKYDDKNRLLNITSASQIDNIKTAKDTSGSIWYNKSSESLDSFVYKENATFQYILNRILKDSTYYLLNKTLINNEGLVSEEISYQRNGDIFIRTIYEYDDLGRITLKATYDSGSTIEKIITKYEYNTIISIEGDIKDLKTFSDNKHELLLKREVISNEKLTWIDKYQYDSLGNVITKETSEIQNNIFNKYQYKYEYDNKGNWTKRIKYQVSLTDNELTPKEVTIRKIYYYPDRTASFIGIIIAFLLNFGYSVFLFLLIIALVFLISYLLFPLKIKFEFNNKALRYTTYVIASMIWIIIGVFTASFYCILYEHTNFWIWLILNVLSNSIIVFILYLKYDDLRDRVKDTGLKIANVLILTERRKISEISKVEFVEYFALKCAFLAFLAFCVYTLYFFLVKINQINHPWESSFYFQLSDFRIWMIIPLLLIIFIIWRIDKYYNKDKIPRI